MKKLWILLAGLAALLLIGFAGTKVAKADHTHCICGTSADTCDVNMTEHGHVRDVQTFTAIDNEADLISIITGPAGTYYRYLSAPITLTDQINFNKGVVLYLCFNGNMITAPLNNRAFRFNTSESGTTLFSICDCGTGGGIQADSNTDSAPATHSGQGGLIWMGNGAHLDIYGGTLQNGKAAGGGNLNLNTCTVRMFGGFIKGGKSLNAVTGGNIRMNGSGAKFSMYGGGLYGGTTESVNGTEIVAQGTLVLSGRASVNSAVDNNYMIGTAGTANITISEAATLRRTTSGKNILQGTNATTTITITGGYFLGGVNFYMATTTVSGGSFFGTIQKSATNNGNAVISGGFFNKAPAGNVEYDSSAIEVGGSNLIEITKKTKLPYVNGSGNYTQSNDVLTLNYMVTTEALHAHAPAVHLDAAYTADLPDTLTTGATWAPWGINQYEKERLPYAEGYYYLVSDIVTIAENKFDETTAMYLCLNGHEIRTPANRVLFNVAGTSNLADSATECVLTDCDQGGTDNAARGKLLYTAPATNGNSTDRLIRLARSRQLYIFRITLDAREAANKNTKTNTGTILYMEGNSTRATFIDAAVFPGETASHSGGIYVVGNSGNSGTFEFIHSSITGGKTTGAGGNIRIAKYVNATIKDSVLSSGEAGTYGGNLYVDANGVLEVIGTTLQDGVAASNGGNFSVPASASATITGGKILGGTSTGNGGSIYVTGGTLYINGDTHFESDYILHYPISVQAGGTIAISDTPTFVQTSPEDRSLLQVTGSAATCTISGGKFDGTFSAIGTLTITGGEFYQGVLASTYNGNSGTINVEAGEFRQLPQQNNAPAATVNVASGYKIVKVAEEARSYTMADSTVVNTVIRFKVMEETAAAAAPASFALYARDLSLNENFALSIYMALTGDVEAQLENAQVRITPEWTGVAEYYDITWNRTTEFFRVKYEGITAEKLGDSIFVELVKDGTVLGSLTTSVKAYCEDTLQMSAADLGYTADQKTALDNVLKTVLNYGAAAQTFFNYKPAALVNENVSGAPTYSDPASAAVTRTGDLFVSATVYHDNANKIRFTIAVDEGSTAPTAAVTRPSDDPVPVDTEYKSFTVSELIATENGKDYYFLYIGGLAPTEYDVSFTATTGGSTVTYSLNQYIGRTLVNANASDVKKAFARAMYAYGMAAEAFATAVPAQ